MPANIPNLGAVHAVGAQFNHSPNVFNAAQKHFAAKSRAQLGQNVQAVQQRNQARDAAAQSAQRVVAAGRTGFVRNVQQTQRAAQTAARARAQGVASGRVAPHPTAPPRTFAMGPTPQQRQASAQANQAQAAQTRAVRSQVNFAHGQAITMANQMSRARQSQVNTAHSQANSMNSQRERTMRSQVNNAHAQALRSQPVNTAPAGQSAGPYNQNEDSGWVSQVGLQGSASPLGTQFHG